MLYCCIATTVVLYSSQQSVKILTFTSQFYCIGGMTDLWGWETVSLGIHWWTWGHQLEKLNGMGTTQCGDVHVMIG